MVALPVATQLDTMRIVQTDPLFIHERLVWNTQEFELQRLYRPRQSSSPAGIWSKCPEVPLGFVRGLCPVRQIDTALWHYGIVDPSMTVSAIERLLLRGETVIVKDQRGPHILKIKIERNQRYSEDVCRIYKVK